MFRLIVLFVIATAAFAQTGIPVVVELFTSEGCSSCPPADDVLARLDSQSPAGRGGKQRASLPPGVEIIALGEHVDYWDQLGWKDRFSSPLFSARQQDYGQAFRVANVYTPQVVVNGEIQVLGSDSRAIQDAIRKASTDARADVKIALTSSQTLSIRVGKLPQGSHPAEILLAITEGGVDTGVYGGENSGRVLHHAAVVRSLTSLGKLDPKYPGEYSANASLSLRAEWNRQNLKLVLFVQDRTTQRILGAAALKP
jgi:hypothetical protein